MSWVTATECPVCGKQGWCQTNGNTIQCMRSAATHPVHGSPTKTGVDTDGNTFAVYLRDGVRPAAKSVRPIFEPTPTLASPDELNEVYRALVNSLSLTAPHAASLQRRGVNPADVRGIFEQLGYRTLSIEGRSAKAAKLIADGHEKKMAGTPGSFVKSGEKGKYWTIGGRPGLLIPIRDVEGRIVRMLVRPDHPGSGGKYAYLTSAKHGGPKATRRVHVPTLPNVDRRDIWITEGPLKADIATYLSGHLVLGMPGCSSFRDAIGAAKDLQAECITIALDADWRTNPKVLSSLTSGIQLVSDAGFPLRLAIWDPATGKGIDDVLAAGHTPEFVEGADAALHRIESEPKQIPPSAPHPDSSDGTILVGSDFAATCKAAREAISQYANPPRGDGGVYRFGGCIAQLQFDPEQGGRLRPFLFKNRDAFVELLSKAANFTVVTDDGCRPAKPPGDVASAILHGGPWTSPTGNIPLLTGVSTIPMLLPDGTVLSTEQYVPSSGLYIQPDIAIDEIDSTLESAKQAAARLLHLVKDFPFESPADRSIWLSLVLTMAARHVVDGPVPAFGINANKPGTGKSLLVSIATAIVYGRPVAVSVAPTDEDEWRKNLISAAIESAPVVAFDNQRGTFGSQCLEAALTAGRVKDRLLFTQTTIDVPWRSIVTVTANNLTLTTDMGRRSLVINLITDLESPEQRSDFENPAILSHASSHRVSLLRDVFTVLSAYLKSGTRQPLPPMGSFEAWSDIIRQAIAFVGLADPLSTQSKNKSRSDTQTEAIATIFTNFENFGRIGVPFSWSAVFEQIEEDRAAGKPYAYEVMDAIHELCGSHGVQNMGYRLRNFRDTPVAGRRLTKPQGKRGLWVLEDIQANVII